MIAIAAVVAVMLAGIAGAVVFNRSRRWNIPKRKSMR